MSWIRDPHCHAFSTKDEAGRKWELLQVSTLDGLIWALWAPPQVALQKELHSYSRLNLGPITEQEAMAKADEVMKAHR